MVAALILPKLLDRIPDRPAMVTGGVILTLGTALGPLAESLPALLPLWAVLGFGYSLTQTPSGRLLRRSAQPEDRPAIFAAQFALSHACWLLTYPLAGRFGAALGLDATFLVMAGMAALGVVLALRLWPAGEAGEIPHEHPDLPGEHPHLREHGAPGHSHPVVIDDLHHRWPKPGHGMA
jgi:predicted MFS family arabinose efflux permease